MTVTDASAFDDPYIPLAFSMHSTPGAYAVLAGAGVSFGSVKTAWAIVVELAQRLCRGTDPQIAATLDENNVETWFEETYGETLTYGGLLTKVAPLPNQRASVLREFFEPEGPDGTPELPDPTDAHREVAQLVAAGAVRVIVTMNFDHLFETALREAGVEPTVISTESGAENRTPLHTMKCCVVHLHGNYTDASSMLNTDAELGKYKPHMQELLSEIVRTHGLVIAGWSAQWDDALRDAITANYRPFYSPAWIDPRPLKGEAQTLATTIGAQVIEATADQAFARLSQAVQSMNVRQARDPWTAAVVVDRIKRDLAGQRPAITAHDTFAAEVGRLDELPAMRNLLAGEDYDDLLAQVDEASRVPAAATAVLARWGTAETDEWWLEALDQWSRAVDLGQYVAGQGEYLDLPLVVGTRLFYAAGIACVAGRRHDVLLRLLQLPVTVSYAKRGLAHSLLAWHSRHETPRRTTNPLRDELAAILADALSVSHQRMDVLWQQFETLRTAATILASPRVNQLINEYIVAHNSLQETTARVGDSPDRREIVNAWTEAQKKLANLSRLSDPTDSRPHVRVAKPTPRDPLEPPRFVSDVAQGLVDSEPHPVIVKLAQPLGQSTAAQIALQATEMSFSLAANDLATRNGSSATSLWLDSPES